MMMMMMMMMMLMIVPSIVNAIVFISVLDAIFAISGDSPSIDDTIYSVVVLSVVVLSVVVVVVSVLYPK